MAVVMSSSHLQQLRGDAVVALVLAMATTAVAGAQGTLTRGRTAVPFYTNREGK
jgi:hypothetical protein